jgi:dipeptidyl aminopeptidase/acylaminoacyl peptidase
MRFVRLAIVLMGCCGSLRPAGAQSGIPTSAILGTRPVAFPAYDAYKGMARYAPTREEYARAIADHGFVMERVTYRSDDLEVFAYVYRPTFPQKGKRLPVVVFNRGSYVRDDFSPEVLMLGNRLARHGFLVVAPMLRGSGGAPGHDEMGGADVHDLFNIVPVLKELPYADPERVFLYGESRGGIMCLLAARDGFPARAMAVYGAITDFGRFIGEGSPARALAPKIWPGFPANEEEIARARSAVLWPEKIGIPVLIMNGGSDRDVPPRNALDLAIALEKAGKPFELKIFYGERHVLTGRAEERDADAAAWFRRFDAPEGGSSR